MQGGSDDGGGGGGGGGSSGLDQNIEINGSHHLVAFRAGGSLLVDEFENVGERGGKRGGK
ncbi:hypothetical protein ZHAS_00009694 [Anopheles sinensis]|uniref:Uncharacterized protein n=1 Tax=Anopheles sinensis TaxID=74873 RepID=A0A084VV57_ANOSI|nr:hypothetical protein ZHAS_00009694 [Anopheles sinensis]